MSAAKPVLYYALRSAPCRAVLMTAAELDVELELRSMDLNAKDHLTPEFLKLNPQHTIPVLVDNDIVIVDSHVICAYLADKYSTNDSLYPKDPVKRMEVDARLFYDCGHLFPRVRLMIEPVIYFGKTEISDEKIAYMQKAYEGLELCLEQRSPGGDGKVRYPYLCGSHLTIADLCCVASVSTAAQFAPLRSEEFPILFEWLDRVSQRWYYDSRNGKGVVSLSQTVRAKMLENEKKQTEAVQAEESQLKELK